MDSRECLAIFLVAILLAGPGICAADDPRVLLVSMLQTDDAELARGLLASASSAVANESGLQMTTHLYGTHSLRPVEVVQQLRVIEGQAAHISIGDSWPEARFLWAENTKRRLSANVDLVWGESMSGFWVRAELQGNKVLLQLDRYSRQPHTENTGHELQQNIRTTVYGHLGDWLDAGGSLALDKELPVNRAYSLKRNDDVQTRYLVKVELAP